MENQVTKYQDFPDVPITVVVSQGDYSIDYSQPRDSLDRKISEGIENSPVGEVVLVQGDTELRFYDPLKMNW